MPNRWIKQAYCTSPRIASVCPEARDLWVRLLVNADDHGYFHGSPGLVASFCYPVKPNARTCERLLSELAWALLIVRYSVSGKAYLAITQWYERARSQPKFPVPLGEDAVLLATANNCEQLQASTTTFTTTSTITSTSTNTLAPSGRISLGFDGWSGVTDSDFQTWAEAYPLVDLKTEMAKARAWAIANPAKQKSNWRRFLVGWFARQQERPRGKEPTLAERRVANIDELTGRVKRGNPAAMDGAPVLPSVSYVREPDDDDVGRLSTG